MTLCGRLFHNCAPLKQKLHFKKFSTGLGQSKFVQTSLVGTPEFVYYSVKH